MTGDVSAASSIVSVDEKASDLGVDPTIRSALPPVTIDGPYGYAMNTLWQKDVAVLVAIGPSIMMCASVLKSVWYRINFPSEKTILRKVYFFWLCEDTSGLEWFKSVLSAIESQNFDDNIEIHPVSLKSESKISSIDMP